MEILSRPPENGGRAPVALLHAVIEVLGKVARERERREFVPVDRPKK